MKRLLNFILLAVGVCASYICYSIFQEKLFNNQYLKSDGTKEKFTFSSATAFFPAFSCYLVGTIRNIVFRQGPSKLPLKQQTILGGSYFIVLYTVSSALVYVSYPTQLVLTNLRLFAIFMVAKFCSRLPQQSKSSSNSKLIVGIFISIGILLFNYEILKNTQEKNNYLWGVFLLTVCLAAQGFMVDSQSYVKLKYNPTSNDLFSSTNKITFFFGITNSLLLGELKPIINFILQHQGFGKDLFLLCLFGTLGQILVYQLVKKFEPHIYATITVFRKIIVVVISIITYNHHISILQIVGLLVIFSGLIYQISGQFKPKNKEVKSA